MLSAPPSAGDWYSTLYPQQQQPSALTSLRAINLTGCEVGPVGAAYLAGAAAAAGGGGGMPALETACLADNGLGPEVRQGPGPACESRVGLPGQCSGSTRPEMGSGFGAYMEGSNSSVSICHDTYCECGAPFRAVAMSRQGAEAVLCAITGAAPGGKGMAAGTGARVGGGACGVLDLSLNSLGDAGCKVRGSKMWWARGPTAKGSCFTAVCILLSATH